MAETASEAGTGRRSSPAEPSQSYLHRPRWSERSTHRANLAGTRYISVQRDLRWALPADQPQHQPEESGPLRIGWGWNGAKQAFRVAIAGANSWIHLHWDWCRGSPLKWRRSSDSWRTGLSPITPSRFATWAVVLMCGGPLRGQGSRLCSPEGASGPFGLLTSTTLDDQVGREVAWSTRTVLRRSRRSCEAKLMYSSPLDKRHGCSADQSDHLRRSPSPRVSEPT